MGLINQVKLLISLAQVDGTVADREKNFIVNIAHANGLKEIEVAPLFDEHHPVIIATNLDDDEKFNYLLNLIQLMKIDDRLYKEELMFCAKIASSLGYNREVMFELILHISSASMAKEEIESLKTITRKYLS